MGKRICIIGLWHQGVVGAACLAEMGYDVLGADHDAGRIAHLSGGKAPLFEPGLDDLIARNLKAGRLKFTADVAGSVRGRGDILLMFDTPVDENDRSNLTELFASVVEIAPGLENDTLLLVTAQAPVGTCGVIHRTVSEFRPSLKFGTAYIPENLRLGQAIDRFMRPVLPVIGAESPETVARVESLFAPLKVKWEHVNLRTAEMIKHSLNAFLATSITFANEIGNLCDEVGADGKRIAEVLRLEPRVGPKAMLFPGAGFAGGTLARDLQTLRGLGDRFGLETTMLDGVWESNKRQNRLVLRKLKNAFGSMAGVKIAVLGLTYKPDTSTLRRSASLEVIAELVAEGAIVTAHDPKADPAEVAGCKGFQFFNDVHEAVREARALVVMTAWPEYKDLDFARIKNLMAGLVVVDINNMLDDGKLSAAGFIHLDVGRGRNAAVKAHRSNA